MASHPQFLKVLRSHMGKVLTGDALELAVAQIDYATGVASVFFPPDEPRLVVQLREDRRKLLKALDVVARAAPSLLIGDGRFDFDKFGRDIVYLQHMAEQELHDFTLSRPGKGRKPLHWRNRLIGMIRNAYPLATAAHCALAVQRYVSYVTARRRFGLGAGFASFHSFAARFRVKPQRGGWRSSWLRRLGPCI